MSKVPVDGSSEAADAQGETGGENKIPQQPEFGIVTRVVGWITSLRYKVLPSPNCDIGPPSLQIQAGCELVPSASDDRRPALRRFILAGEIERHHVDFSKPRQGGRVSTGLEGELRTKGRQEIIARGAIARNTRTKKSSGF